MDSIKTWIVEVLLKKMGPSFLKGAIAWIFVYFGAHQGLLNSIGITWDGQGHTIDIDLDTLSNWALAIGSGSILALFTATAHHVDATITGKPQDGSHQRSTDALPGGN